MNDSVASDALVMPSSIGSSSAGHLALLLRDPLVDLEHARAVELLAAQQRRVAGCRAISILRSIWRMITSMCLSLIFTPCRR